MKSKRTSGIRRYQTNDAIAYYGHRLSENITQTGEGYLICRGAAIARTGRQDYLPEELGLPGGEDRLIPVDRPAEEVFTPEAIASFEGKPVTDGHPPEDVTPANHPAYARGHVQNVRRCGEYLLADLYITDSRLAEEILRREKREISCGYRCTYETMPDGSRRQANIRGNHVAVVPEGRAGHRVAIQDEKGRRNMSEFMKAVAQLPEKLERLISVLEALSLAWAPAAEETAEAPAVEEALEVLADPEVAAAMETVAAALPEETSADPALAPVYPESLLPSAPPAPESAAAAADTLRRIHQAAAWRAGRARDGRPGSYRSVCAAQQRAYAARNPHKK